MCINGSGPLVEGGVGGIVGTMNVVGAFGALRDRLRCEAVFEIDGLRRCPECSDDGEPGGTT